MTTTTMRSVLGLTAVCGSLLATGAAGCAKTDSEDLLTSGMYAELQARTKGDASNTAAVSAVLYVDDPADLNFVQLDPGDQLVASQGSESEVMDQVELGNIVSHGATLMNGAAGTQITIALDRHVDQGAPSSTATLPDAFTLAGAPLSESRGHDVTITWTPSGTADQMSWQAVGECIVAATGNITGDPGTFTLAANTLVQESGQNAPTTCTVTLTVSRTRKGSLDPHYGKGGTIVGAQDREAAWTSMP
jgi:hypothetical protein